jgi:hypothetical protein
VDAERKIPAQFAWSRRPEQLLNPNQISIVLSGFFPDGQKTVDVYVYIQGQRRGPYEKAQLEEMWKGGQIPADTLCWHEGMPQWGLVSDLFANTKMAPPLSTEADNAESITFPAAS